MLGFQYIGFERMDVFLRYQDLSHRNNLLFYIVRFSGTKYKKYEDNLAEISKVSSCIKVNQQEITSDIDKMLNYLYVLELEKGNITSPLPIVLTFFFEFTSRKVWSLDL